MARSSGLQDWASGFDLAADDIAFEELLTRTGQPGALLQVSRAEDGIEGSSS